ncbi:MAG TPA: beta-galactosidase, partial [Clostridia bacterium]|nr:beta-galactosidase [Clostridia bacterium]
KAVVEHFNEEFKDYPGGNPIFLYAPCFTNNGEMEYHGGDYSSDYSPAAINAFRNWLRNRYVDIRLLNERWKTSYTSFDQAEAPMIGGNTTVQEMDWLEYRAYEQGRIIKDQAEIVKAADPNALYVMVFGSVFDPVIIKRGTLFADYWTDYVDWIGVADAWGYNHRYSMSVVRGISKGKGFYNEVFREQPVNSQLREEYYEFTTQCFDEGANQINYAGFPFNDVGSKSYDYYKVPEEIIKDNQKVTRPKPDRAMYMSTWSITRDTWSITWDGQGYFNELRNSGYIDVIRDGTFENDVDYLVNNYKDIYFYRSDYISDAARAALLEAYKRGVRMHDMTGTYDKFGNERLPFDKIDKDATAPTVKAASASGFIAGIADDVGSGINRIEVEIGGETLIAQGTDTWRIDTTGKSGTAKVTAIDNNGNRSAQLNVVIK